MEAEEFSYGTPLFQGLVYKSGKYVNRKTYPMTQEGKQKLENELEQLKQ